MNQYFQNMIGASSFWYQVTEIGEMSLLAIIGYFLLCGLQQWYKRKKISLVDKKIVYLGFLYVVSAVAYLFLKSNYQFASYFSRSAIRSLLSLKSYFSYNRSITFNLLHLERRFETKTSSFLSMYPWSVYNGCRESAFRGSLDIRYPWRNIVRSFICFILRGSIERE